MRVWRYERKYALEVPDYRAISQEIMMQPAGFQVQHPDRCIRNIYFDTRDLSALNTNFYGVAERTKHRVRWYGDRELPSDHARWEAKIKFNTLGAKDVESIAFADDATLADIAAEVQKRLRPEEQLVPTLLNSYNRSYFVTPDQKFRMTVDRDMEFLPLFDNNDPTRIPYTSSSVIVEFKYDGEWDDEASEIMQYLPFRQTKFSKYVTGMMMVS